MNYYLGPLPWVDTDPDGPPCWQPPAGTVGMVDVRSIPDQSGAAVGADLSPAFLAVDGALDSTWTFLGSGDCREIATTGAIRNRWQAATGYRPSGGRVVDLLWDQLTTGSDPSGDSAVKPLVPTSEGKLELWLPGHSLIKSEPFAWGVHGHTSRLRDLLLIDCEGLFQQVDAGLMEVDQVRRILGGWLRKYGLPDAQWRSLVPPHRQSEIPGPLPPATTYSESFDGGFDLTWTDVEGDLASVSNQGDPTGTTESRAEHALSSDDHYAEADLIGDTGTYSAVTCRHASAAVTYYMYNEYAAKSRLYKCVTGGYTQLDQTSGAGTLTFEMQVQTDGSTITGYRDDVERHSETDTAITGNTRCGLRFSTPAAATRVDNFVCADLAAGTSYDRTTSDTLGLSDAASRKVASKRTATDTAGLSGAVIRASTNKRVVANTGGLSDDVTASKSSPATSYDVTVADGILFQDPITLATGHVRVATDTLGLGDDVTAQKEAVSYGVTVVDTLGLSDAAIRKAAHERVAVDTLGLSDEASRTVVAFRSELETLGLGDAVGRVVDAYRSAVDTAGLSDFMTRAFSGLRSAADTVGLSDTVTIAVQSTGELTATPTDTIGLSDNVSRAVTHRRVVSDLLGASDEALRACAINRSVSDGLALSDEASRTSSIQRSTSDSLGTSDQAARTATIARFVQDGLGLSEATSALLEAGQSHTRLATKTLGLSDLVTLTLASLPPDQPGLEATLPTNRMHYTLPTNRPHATLPENRMHFRLPSESGRS
jgi:hypothetical protein